MRRFAIAALAFTVVIGCSTKNPEFASLMNQGPLALSTDNPYLGTNLFLSHEMESSSYLYQFMMAKGGPTAIELVRKHDWDEPQVYLYYPKNREMYVASAHADKRKKEWIVRGPFAIDRGVDKQLQRMEDVKTTEPIFEIWGSKQRLGWQNAPQQAPQVIVPVYVPTPTPKPLPRRTPRAVVPTPVATPTPLPPSNFDQKALQDAKSFAERNATGDVVHTVKGSNETINSLAAWYAGDAGAAQEIADKNGLTPDAPLAAGARITIPARLVKNPKQMQ